MAVPWRYPLKDNKILIMFNSKFIYYNICHIYYSIHICILFCNNVNNLYIYIQLTGYIRYITSVMLSIDNITDLIWYTIFPYGITSNSEIFSVLPSPINSKLSANLFALSSFAV